MISIMKTQLINEHCITFFQAENILQDTGCIE